MSVFAITFDHFFFFPNLKVSFILATSNYIVPWKMFEKWLTLAWQSFLVCISFISSFYVIFLHRTVQICKGAPKLDLYVLQLVFITVQSQPSQQLTKARTGSVVWHTILLFKKLWCLGFFLWGVMILWIISLHENNTFYALCILCIVHLDSCILNILGAVISEQEVKYGHFLAHKIIF